LRLKKLLLLGAALVLPVLLTASLASADTGGPDAGGYRFIDNNQPNGPAYAFQDISSTGTSAFPGGCDDCVLEDIPLGFTFEFYGVDYTVVTIQTNGVLLFGDGHSDDEEYENESIPTGEFEAAIMAFWDDLYPYPAYCDGSAVYYQSVGAGANQRFIVQWTSCHYDYSHFPECTVSVQVHLLEGRDSILMFYDDTIFGEGGCDAAVQPQAPQGDKPQLHLSPAALPFIDEGASATVGIQESSDSGLQYTYDGERSLINGLAICFYEGSDPQACGEARQERPRPPSIGAGLSGLFVGQPTPLPTAPAAVAPAATSPVITPPRTGDAGLAPGETHYATFFLATAIALGALVGLRRRHRA
jgi:hypothetical protein